MGGARHDGKGIKVKPHYICKNPLQQFTFIIGALLSIGVVPSPNSVDCHNEKRARATGWIEQALIRIAFISKLIKDMVCQPVGCVILTQIVAHGLWEQLLV